MNTNIHPLWKKIRDNVELQNLENKGFYRGDISGKNPDVGIDDYNEILHKQFADYLRAFKTSRLENRNPALLKALADLRNVVGLMFLMIDDPNSLQEGKE